MRHRRKGRVLGRSPAHRKALLRNLSSALFLTERDASLDDNAPKVPGRIVTTLEKAKEVRPLVEKCITIAKRSLPALEEAQKYETSAERGSDEYKKWRKSDDWKKWADARAPYVNAQRRVLQLIGDREAVSVLFDTVAERYVDRPGGYTRIMRLATPRLGDGGTRAILELVGKNDRVTRSAQRPAFEQDAPESDATPEAEATSEEEATSAS
ncbi:bL17 family ribosomal protein [Rhodopirellula halodulae]|uniref:bL17 family ribosomal protein n=1 Tax=Rhodopirellula halodulae TaxID=2894198 RepID=UPI001E35B832|nr:L17 family ribosomal protein [Rhodopirellula sp. JC737]MCC9655774.1 50S ribosomal protein L17 [Rhodopirellula sp. JC737]